MRHARIGAFYSAILPIIIGLLVSMGLAEQEFNIDKAFNLPLTLAFIFGTPIAAWLTQDELMKRPKVTYWDIIEIGLIRATIIQAAFGIIFLIYYLLHTQNVGALGTLLSMGLALQAIFWVLITLPLTIVCAVVFKLSAMRPVYQ